MKKWITIIPGLVFLSIALNQILEPHSLVIGGATGVGIILKKLFNIPLSITNLMINIPLLIAAIKIKGFSFVKNTLIATLLLSAILEITAFIPPVKTDLILAAVFGGILSGMGIGLIFKGNATTGGSDLLASIIHQFYPYIKTSRIMFVIDMIIVLTGMFALGVTPSLYALISIYIMSKIINIVLEGLDFAKAVFITSPNCAAIGLTLTTELKRGATYIDCKGVYSKENKGMLLIVVSAREIGKLKEIVYHLDKSAFVIVNDVREIQGNFRKWTGR